MSGFACSKSGTFGKIIREYTSQTTQESFVVIEWGPMRWVSPVLKQDVYFCKSGFEAEARAEAEAWVNEVKK